MSVLSSLVNGIVFYRALAAYLRTPLDRTGVQEIVVKRLDAREARFLQVVRSAIYDRSDSPYRTLLKAAGCEFGDVAALVRDRGIEDTLRHLADSGVYVTLDEFKGTEPIRRFGQEFPIRVEAFDNPSPGAHYVARTGATQSSGRPVPISLDSLAEQSVDLALTLGAWGIGSAGAAQWFPTYPGTGLNNVLRFAKVGIRLSRWFTQVDPRDYYLAPKARMLTGLVFLAGRRTGMPIPSPELTPFDAAERIARWIEETKRQGWMPAVRTFVSSAVRIAEAAQARGIDVSDARLFVVGESLTRSKRQAVAASGARPIPDYSITEAGLIAVGCAEDTEEDRMHLLTDLHACITRRRVINGSEETVDSFHLTSLSPHAPKILLNVEMGDSGRVEPAQCGCPMHQAGLATTLRDVRSFEKLTSEGMTLPGADFVEVVEDVFPALFGGSPLDYQIVEEEDSRGMTRLSVMVSPRLGSVEPQRVIEAFLDELRRRRPKSNMVEIWRQAGTLRVLREPPRLTRGGKLLPFYALGSGRGSRSVPVTVS